MSSMGRLQGNDTIHFERTLPGPAARVWEHLTSSAHLPVWFGGEGMEFSIEPRVGGRVHLMGGAFHGVVKEWRPSERLVVSWNLAGVPAPETLVTFDLADEGGIVRLALSQGPIAAGFQAATFSGWHTFLDRLEAMLRGEAPGDAMEAMQRHREAYLVDFPEGTARL
jgi:uncharacterized protein YndB with AHSA1/START domain